jgi:hypothetical protein
MIRKVVAVATALGLAAGANLIGAGSALAVASTWECITVYGPVGGMASGDTCHGIGYGTGWLEVYTSAGYEIVTRCNLTPTEVFPPPPANPYYNVTGISCYPAGPPPPDAHRK